MILSRGNPRGFRRGNSRSSFCLALSAAWGVAPSLGRHSTTEEEDVLLGWRRQRPAVEAAPARDQGEVGAGQQPRNVARFEQPMDEIDAAVGGRAPLARAYSPVVERRRQQPSIESIALRIFGRTAGRRVLEPRPRPSPARDRVRAAEKLRVRGEGVEGEPAARRQRARDAREEARQLAIGRQVLDGVEGRDGELKRSARDREPAKIRAQQQRAAAERRAPGGRRAPPPGPASWARGRARRRRDRRAAAATAAGRSRSRDPGWIRRARQRACRRSGRRRAAAGTPSRTARHLRKDPAPALPG